MSHDIDIDQAKHLSMELGRRFSLEVMQKFFNTNMIDFKCAGSGELIISQSALHGTKWFCSYLLEDEEADTPTKQQALEQALTLSSQPYFVLSVLAQHPQCGGVWGEVRAQNQELFSRFEKEQQQIKHRKQMSDPLSKRDILQVMRDKRNQSWADYHKTHKAQINTGGMMVLSECMAQRVVHLAKNLTLVLTNANLDQLEHALKSVGGGGGFVQPLSPQKPSNSLSSVERMKKLGAVRARDGRPRLTSSDLKNPNVQKKLSDIHATLEKITEKIKKRGL